MEVASWLWIPITVAAAAAQTVRNAVQRNVTRNAGVLPATFIRFFFGLPFAAVGLAALALTSPEPLPRHGGAFVAWVALGAVAQVVSAAFFVAAMAHRSFVVAVVFTKTEILQIGIYSVLFLGESLSGSAMLAIVLSTVGVLLLTGKPGGVGAESWMSKGAMLGLASGATVAIASIGYRGAMLSVESATPWFAGMYGLVWAQTIQVILLGGYLAWRDRAGLARVIVEWRLSIVAGLAAALATLGWFTAYTMRSAVDVRIVALVEVLFSFVVSHRLFREPVSRMEVIGGVLVIVGIVLVSVAG